MNIGEITTALRESAVPVVFTNALLQQLGLPVPALPTLLIAGSLAVSQAQLAQLIAAAMVASLAADALWYAAGRAYGYRVLIRLCKLSLNPGSCVTSTETLFMRWGAWSLIVAKLVPGLSTVGPPVAGSLRLAFASFLAASAIGAGIWAGGGILAGWLWRAEVASAVTVLVEDATLAAIVAALCATLWVAWAVWRRRQFRLSSAIPSMGPPELAEAMASDAAPLLLDLRGPALKASTPPIDGATPVQLDDLGGAVGHWSKHRSIVAMCACPADDVAKAAALRLFRCGYKAVFVLRGGYESWVCYTAGDEGARGTGCRCLLTLPHSRNNLMKDLK